MKLVMIFLLTILTIFSEAGLSQSIQPTEREIQNLTAFAKVYGYTKYFHPSDEARQINWDKFAILGTEKVLKANDQNELIDVLKSLFLPIAPTIQLSQAKPESQSSRQNYLNLINRDTTRLKKVAWQHEGVNMSFTQRGPYQSIRTNRKDRAVDSNFFLFQNFDAEEYRNQTVQLSSMIIHKEEDQNGFAELVISINNQNSSLISKEVFKIPADSNSEWNLYEVESKIPEDAQKISAGVKLNGKGEVWIDDVNFVMEDSDEVESLITNGIFEEEYYGRPVGWRSTLSGSYTYRIDQENAFEGESSFYIADSEPQLPDQLFEQVPKVGESIIEEIAKHTWAEVPLSLYSEYDSTLPKADDNLLQALKEELNRIDLDRASGNDRMVRLAGIIIAWNELQHFFPYFDVIETDWNEQLIQSLISAYHDTSGEEYYYTLSKLVTSLEDGHGRVLFPPMESKVGFPFIVDWIDNQVVVTHSEYKQILPGDIIKSVDRVPADEIVDSKQQLLSGSDHYTLFQALRQFAFGDEGTIAKIQIERNGDAQTVDVSRTGSVDYAQMEKGDRIMIGHLEEEIFYVDLDEASIDTIKSRIEEVSSAESVIFDLRGYPEGNHDIISHLLSQPDTSDSWMRIPQIIYPDQKDSVSFDKSGWQIPTAEPQIEGNVIFIIDSRAISYAESFMSFIEHYQLAEIVGQPTAGTNGSVNSFSLPGDYRITWTGMKVLKHDGSQLYKVGIEPTIKVDKTIEGVRKGRDEFLEKAVEIANGN